MAMIAIRVPEDIARLLATLEVPGDREPQGHFHVTLVNMGDGVSIEQLAKTVAAVFEVTKGTTPFSAQVQDVSTFPAGDDGAPVICPVKSESLHQLQHQLCEALDRAGVPYSTKFKTFRPHVTLGYCKDPDADQQVKGITFPAVQWGVGEVMLFGGDSGDGTFTATFPFTLEGSKAASVRALVRLAVGWEKRKELDFENRQDLKQQHDRAEVEQQERQKREWGDLKQRIEQEAAAKAAEKEKAEELEDRALLTLRHEMQNEGWKDYSPSSTRKVFFTSVLGKAPIITDDGREAINYEIRIEYVWKDKYVNDYVSAEVAAVLPQKGPKTEKKTLFKRSVGLGRSSSPKQVEKLLKVVETMKDVTMGAVAKHQGHLPKTAAQRIVARFLGVG